MQIRQICFYCAILLLTMSLSFLTYLTITAQIGFISKLRFINFILQHLFTIVMLIKRKYFCNQDDDNNNTWSHILWLIGFTSINFASFVIVEIYCAFNEKDQMEEPIDDELQFVSFTLLSYFHLYFQYNVYLGVFCLFSFAMAIVYYLNQRRHRHQVQQVVDSLQSNRYSTSWGEQNCSICIAQFTKSQVVYRLVCGHVFHKECLQDWLKQKLTCPMCRDDLTRTVNQYQNLEQQSQIE